MLQGLRSSLEAIMRIGELAQGSRLGIETIRRGENGYRVFDEDALARARFIQQARDLGFTLAEIKELLELRLDAKATRRDVRSRTQAKLDEIARKIAQLQGMQGALKRLLDCCHGAGPALACPILEGIEKGAAKLPRRKSHGRP
jgi:MerR family transcriptional regulator, copper efflux regulator